ncbi:hypothetical protein B0H14DRAFT_3887911 [Mycena olivaceomarginata]|nr:hypothetical protein B0H14DRAFT_3887911 [Mycena olivaceomarginata]
MAALLSARFFIRGWQSLLSAFDDNHGDCDSCDFVHPARRWRAVETIRPRCVAPSLAPSLAAAAPRNSSQSHIDVQHHLQLQIPRELSPSPPTASNAPASPAVPMHANNNSYNRRRNGPPPVSGQGQLPSTSPAQGGLSLGHMLRRRRSAGNVNGNGAVPPTPRTRAPPPAPIPPAPAPAATTTGAAGGTGTHRIRLVPHLDSRRSLRFDPIARDLKPGEPALRIGRFTDRSGLGLAAVNALSTNKIAFKSKVVSRAHAEVWIEDASGGGGGGVRFLIRDTKSSSGTFLNIRPHPLKDGDILQLGVDYQGGAEDIYKSVKIRIEIGREWQSAANAFNDLCMDVDVDTIGFYHSFSVSGNVRSQVPIYTYRDGDARGAYGPGAWRIVSCRYRRRRAHASSRLCLCLCLGDVCEPQAVRMYTYRDGDGDERPVRIRGLVAFASRIVTCRRRSVCRRSPYVHAYACRVSPTKLAAGRRWAAFRPTPASRACTSAGLGLGRARPGCFRHSFEWGGELLRACSSSRPAKLDVAPPPLLYQPMSTFGFTGFGAACDPRVLRAVFEHTSPVVKRVRGAMWRRDEEGVSVPSFVRRFACPAFVLYFISTTALKNLKSLAIAPSVSAPASAAEGGAAAAAAAAGGKRKAGMGIPDCCICLSPSRSARRSSSRRARTRSTTSACGRCWSSTTRRLAARSAARLRTWKRTSRSRRRRTTSLRTPTPSPRRRRSSPTARSPDSRSPTRSWRRAYSPTTWKRRTATRWMSCLPCTAVAAIEVAQRRRWRIMWAGTRADSDLTPLSSFARNSLDRPSSPRPRPPRPPILDATPRPPPQRTSRPTEPAARPWTRTLPPLPDAEDGDEMDVESGEGSRSEHGQRLSGEGLLGGATLQGKRKR